MIQTAGPLQPARGRLRDAEARINEAAAAYGDPFAFRQAVNAALQDMRNAENLVRSHKGAIPGFDAWYAPWIAWMRGNRFLRWLVKARDTVVHQADLELQSEAKTLVIVSYDNRENLRGPTAADPKKSSLEIARELRAELLLDPAMPRHGVIRVDRKWFHSVLGDAELLSTLIYCHQCLVYFVFDCFARLLDTSAPSGTPSIAAVHSYLDSCTPDKMSVPDAIRTLSVELGTGEPMYVRAQEKARPEGLPNLKEHYGVEPAMMPLGKGVTLRELVHFFEQQARVVMRVDGHHLSLAFLFREGIPVKTVGMRFENNSQKYAIWEQVAKEVASVGADRVVVISEAWAAPFNPTAPHLRAEDSLERREFLHIVAADETGDSLQQAVPIGRVAGKPILGTPMEMPGPAPAFLSAVYQVWKGKAVR